MAKSVIQTKLSLSHSCRESDKKETESKRDI